MQTVNSVTDICINCEHLIDSSFATDIILPFRDAEIALAFLSRLALQSTGQPKCRLGVTERKNAVCPIGKFSPRIPRT